MQRYRDGWRSVQGPAACTSPTCAEGSADVISLFKVSVEQCRQEWRVVCHEIRVTGIT
jgi:hypothetical protein